MDAALFAPVVRLVTYAPLFGAMLFLSHPSVITQIPNVKEHPMHIKEAERLAKAASERHYFYAPPPTSSWLLMNEEDILLAQGDQELIRNREIYQALTFIAIEILVCFKQLLHLADKAVINREENSRGKLEFFNSVKNATEPVPSILFPMFFFYVIPTIILDQRWMWENTGWQCPPAQLRNTTTFTVLGNDGLAGSNHERLLWLLRRLPLILHPLLHLFVCAWPRSILSDDLLSDGSLGSERLPKASAMFVLVVILLTLGLVARYLAMSHLVETKDLYPIIQNSVISIWVTTVMLLLFNKIRPAQQKQFDDSQTDRSTAVSLSMRLVGITLWCAWSAAIVAALLTGCMAVLSDVWDKPVQPSALFVLKQIGLENRQLTAYDAYERDPAELASILEEHKRWVKPLLRANEMSTAGNARMLEVQTVAVHSQPSKSLERYAEEYNRDFKSNPTRLSGIGSSAIHSYLTVQPDIDGVSHLILHHQFRYDGRELVGEPDTTACGNNHVMHATLGKGSVLAKWDNLPSLLWRGEQSTRVDGILIVLCTIVLSFLNVDLGQESLENPEMVQEPEVGDEEKLRRLSNDSSSKPIAEVEAIRWQRLAEVHREDRNKQEVKAFLDDPNIDEQTRKYFANTFTTIQERAQPRLSIAMISSLHMKLRKTRKRLQKRMSSTSIDSTELSDDLSASPVADGPTASDLDTWAFDATELSPLQLEQYGQLLLLHASPKNDAYVLSKTRVQNFVHRLANKYADSNPYHNFSHAVDVAQFLYKLLRVSDSILWLEPTDLLACMVSGLAHDVAHPGLNNQYQIMMKSELAVTYNDKSPLENMHASTLFCITQDDTCNIFDCLNDEQALDVRRTIIHAILGTDMVYHFEIVSKLKVMMSGYEIFEQQQGLPHIPFHVEGAANSNRLLYLKGSEEPKHDGYRQQMVELLLHTADIGNVMRPNAISVKWSMRVMEEFFLQGDAEINSGLTSSPFFSRETNIPTVQFNFIEYIISPIAIPLLQMFPSCSMLGDSIVQNGSHWIDEFCKSKPDEKECTESMKGKLEKLTKSIDEIKLQ